jgi:hypothetical protein
MGIEVNGTTFETDEEGYLVNLAEWNEDIANVIAKTENVEMTPSHWEVVNFLRDYYNEYPGRAGADEGDRQTARPRQGQQQVPVRAVPLRPGQAGVQDRRPAETDRLRLGLTSCEARAHLIVIPANAGIHGARRCVDTGVRRYDP